MARSCCHPPHRRTGYQPFEARETLIARRSVASRGWHVGGPYVLLFIAGPSLGSIPCLRRVSARSAIERPATDGPRTALGGAGSTSRLSLHSASSCWRSRA